MAGPAPRSLPILFAALFLLIPAARAEGPPIDAKQFPKLVRLLLLPEEQSLLKELKDERDRLEFQKIFWARRDPTPGTGGNEFEDGVRAAWARADQVFTMPNERGAATGCGQLLALLGPPELVEGLDTQARFDNLQAVREGSRRPETWTWRDRPGRAYTFTRAELRVAFDSECRFDEGGILLQDIRRAAAANVTRPDLAYARGAGGHLVPLATQSGGAAGAIDLLTTPRSDFPLAAETKLVLRAPKGEALVAGLVKLPGPLAGGRVSLAVRAADAGGQPQATGVRESALAPLPDGSGIASWSVALKPGRFQLTVAVQRSDDGKGSLATLETEVPDFGGSALVASPIVAYADELSAGTPGDARDPYAALQLGTLRIHPRFGNVFAPADALMVVATVHGAKLDAASGQAALRSRYSILKDGKPVARGAQDVFTTADAVASVGPIPLANYAPGAYVIRLDVTDGVSQQTLRQEARFEIRAAAVTP